MELEKVEKSFNFILFGASGDLAQLKLFPAIYELVLQNRFAKDYTIFGFARSKMTDNEFKKKFADSVKKHIDKKVFNQKVLDDFLEKVHYHQGQYDDSKSYDELAERLLKAHKGKKVYNLAFFAIPPVAFKPIIENLAILKGKLGQNIDLMLEKPFGEDRKSAGELFQFVTNHFAKEHLFLIDHYLGKAPVRSIFPLRYNNAILNLLLKGQAISNIQISALETLGVDERVGFFDNVGIIKDMIQSHLLQVLALLTMSMPVHREVHRIQREKGDIISALRVDPKCGIVLGQYDSYSKQEGVKKGSKTPTFAALKLFIDLTEWYEVPIYIRTGKNLSHKHTYIAIEFKKPPYAKDTKIEANRLIIELYPKEEIQIKLVNDLGKEVPNYNELITEESLACMGDDCLPPYANLILDALLSRHVSFLSIDEILASWHFVDDVHKRIKKEKIEVVKYKEGSCGPKEQEELTKGDNNKWYDAESL